MTQHLTEARADAAAAITAAEQEADEAARLLEALEERVRDGDDTVTPNEIASARELGNFARLRADATARKAAAAQQTARTLAIQELRAEIEQHSQQRGTQYAQLLRTAEDSLRAFLNAASADNEQLRQWRQRMVDLDIPEVRAYGPPATEHAGLAYSQQQTSRKYLSVDGRHIDTVDPEHWIRLLLTRVTRGTQGFHHIQQATRSIGNGADMYERLESLNGPTD